MEVVELWAGGVRGSPVVYQSRRDRALDLTAHSANLKMVTTRDGNMNIQTGQF